MPTRTFLPFDDTWPAAVFKLFLSHLGAFGEAVGFGLEGLGEGLGEALGAQHAWLIFAGEAKRSGEKHNLLTQLPECPREVRNDAGVKLMLLWGAGRGQPLGPVCSRVSCWPLSFHELFAQGEPHSGFVLKSGLKQLVQTVELGRKL